MGKIQRLEAQIAEQEKRLIAIELALNGNKKDFQKGIELFEDLLFEIAKDYNKTSPELIEYEQQIKIKRGCS